MTVYTNPLGKDVRGNTEFSEVVLMDTDHAGICKPKSPEDDVYLRITGFIHRILEDIPSS
ncbi:hypothetical protein ACTXT7_006166 [Hymenolepis weldensis]